MVFKLLFFLDFKNTKKPGKVDFLVFNGFLDIFRINFALKPCGYYFFIIILFSIYMNLHHSDLHPLQRMPPIDNMQ